MVKLYTEQSFKFSLCVVLQRWFLAYSCNFLPSKDEDTMLFAIWLTIFQEVMPHVRHSLTGFSLQRPHCNTRPFHQSIWDLCWTEWLWDMPLSLQFGFSHSLSSHQCSIFIKLSQCYITLAVDSTVKYHI